MHHHRRDGSTVFVIVIVVCFLTQFALLIADLNSWAVGAHDVEVDDEEMIRRQRVVEVARLDRNPTRRAPMPVVAVVVLVMVEGLLAALAMFTCNTVCPHEAVVDDRAIPCT